MKALNERKEGKRGNGGKTDSKDMKKERERKRGEESRRTGEEKGEGRGPVGATAGSRLIVPHPDNQPGVTPGATQVTARATIRSRLQRARAVSNT